MLKLSSFAYPICNFRPCHCLPQTRIDLRLSLTYAVILFVSLAGATAVAGVATANLTLPPAPFRSPYIPAADDEVLQEVPSSADPAVVQMKKLRAAFDAAPQSLVAAKQLADAYIDYSRQIGDAHFAGYAEAIISPWLRLPNPPAVALVTQAIILQYRHLFDEARALLRKALKADPLDAQAWLTSGHARFGPGQLRNRD